MALLIRRLSLGPYQTNCYILACLHTLEAVIVDPGAEGQRLLAEARCWQVRYILLTHGHPDHIGALSEVRKGIGAPTAFHALDSPLVGFPPDLELQEGDTLVLGRSSLRVLHLPGHTPGGLGFLVGHDLFSGDTLFPGGPGHTNSAAEQIQLVRTIREKLFTLPEDTTVYPGHGLETTIGREEESSREFMRRVEVGVELWGELTWDSGRGPISGMS